MNVLVIGGTGFTGKKVIDKLLTEGHKTTILVRNIAPARHAGGLLTVAQGDIFNRRLLEELITGQDAVISCLGIGGLGDGRPNDFVSQATKGIVEIMGKVNVRRLICMSNVGAGDSKDYMGWVGNKVIIPLMIPKLLPIIEDKNRMEAYIAASPLDFTIVRLPNITDKPAKDRVTATTTGKGLRRNITVEDAAGFLVSQLASQEFIRQYPSVSN